MYIWVVLAAFIATLYSYNLAFRADYREVTVSPRAQSIASKMVIQHEAASRYMRDNAVLRGAGGFVDYSQGVTFTQGLISKANMEEYLPYGYNFDGDLQYRSYTYCLDKRDFTLSTPITDCGDEFSIPYMITYGCVAQKWVSLTTGKPNKDLEFGIMEAKKLGAEMGYTEDFSHMSEAEKISRLSIHDYQGIVYDAGGNTIDNSVKDFYGGYGDDHDQYIANYYIMRGRARPVPIPLYISGVDDDAENFASICGDTRKCQFCLAYITSF